LYDTDAYVARVFQHVPDAPLGYRIGFRIGVAGSWRKGMVTTLEVADPNAGVKLLRVRSVRGEVRAVFRMIVVGGGVSYFEFVLTPPDKGGPKIADTYILGAGDYQSALAVPGVTNGVRRLAAGRGADESVEDAKRLKAIHKLVRDIQPAEALDAWDDLPVRLQHQKVFQLVRLRAGALLAGDDPDRYRKALDAYLERFPNDPSAAIVCIDGLFLAGKYEAARKQLALLEKAVGGDPYVDVMRAGSFLLEGNTAAAATAAGRAAKAEPQLPHARWALVMAAAADEDYPAVVRGLIQLETVCGWTPDDLSNRPGLDDFRESAEYTAWTNRKK
ncbi:MAG: hypothetical protein ACRC7O_13590, partial [Fimbriiglobus sp.]